MKQIVLFLITFSVRFVESEMNIFREAGHYQMEKSK